MLRRLTSIFKPHKSGLGRVLGALEKSVMDILWERGEATGREVFEGISREKTLAFTTVLTVMDRLLKKGLIKRAKRGGVFVYTASMTKDNFVKQISQEVLQGILDISASSAASSFVDLLYKTNPEEIDRLSKLIVDKKKGRVKT